MIRRHPISTQSRWSAASDLYKRQRTGWWNVHRFTGGDTIRDEPENLTPIDAEIGGPHWVFGESWYAVLPDDTLVVSLADEGLTGLGYVCLLYTSPSPRDRPRARMPPSA